MGCLRGVKESQLLTNSKRSDQRRDTLDSGITISSVCYRIHVYQPLKVNLVSASWNFTSVELVAVSDPIQSCFREKI